MEYWNTLITEKSWNILQKIKDEMDFILIGGWAVFLWARSHKSKDIDIVINHEELNKLKLKYKISKNDRLKKYEISIENIDVGIYVPYYSNLPLLEHIENYITSVEGFKVAKPEFLIILKQAAEMSGANTEKGLKDRIDIFDLLLKSNVNLSEYNKIILKENLTNFRERLIRIITEFNDFKYLDLNPRELKFKKNELIRKIRERPK